MKDDIEYIIQAPQEIKKELCPMRLRVSKLNSMHVVHKAIIKQLNGRRQGSANCKTRSEVRGGGKKPWKQKGTGKARAGSNRSPLWRGGGVIFGPKAKNYSQKVNKKERQLAMRNMLFNKQDFTLAVEPTFLNLDKPKTRLLISNIAKLNIDKTEKILFIMAKKNRNVYLAARNLSNVEIITADQLNLLSIIKAKYILADASAIKIITETYNG